jgi:hypothetical protein
MRERQAERYWLEFDKAEMTLRVVISQDAWQVVQGFIDEAPHQAVVDGHIVLCYRLTPQDGPSICMRLDGIFTNPSLTAKDNPVSDNWQLMEIRELGQADESGSCYIDVRFARPFQEWIARQGVETESATRAVIAFVYQHLHPSVPADAVNDAVHVNLGNDQFRYETFGSCACLGYDGMSRPGQDGFVHLVPHNIDLVAQLLSLLAGLAYLCGIAHQELYGSPEKVKEG